jgi:hypothetical protein
VTHRAGTYHQSIRPLFAILAGAAALVLAACGGSARSTLPPKPGPAGRVALRLLAHHPEVYSDAIVQTVGTVRAVRIGHRRLFALEGGGGGAQIVLEPTSLFTAENTRRVRVTGTFVVTFEIGYEILASRVTRVSG